MAKNDKKIKKDNIVIEIAKKEDAEEIHNIMKTVYDNMNNKDFYVCDDLNYVKTQLKGDKGFGVVARNSDNKIVASFIIRYPMQSKDNLGNDVNLPKDKLNYVVHMETTVVLPEYRGRHLQKTMLSYIENLIDKKRFNIFMATVAPGNIPSCKTFENTGYTKVLTKIKYGNLLRNIYMKIYEWLTESNIFYRIMKRGWWQC